MNFVIRNIGFLIVSSVIGAYSIAHTSLSAIELSAEDAIRGATAQSLESRFENALPIREFGVNFWSAIRFALFNSGDTGVVLGTDGWLFTAEEFYAPENGSENLQTNLKTISAVQQELTAQGIELVIVPVPSKARVREDKLVAIPDALHRSIYDSLTSHLTNQQIQFVDTAKRFATDGGDLFFKTDTHWLPEAAALAAEDLKQFVINTEEQEFDVINIDHQPMQGDLLNFLSLDPWFEQLAPASETLMTYDVVARGNELDLFANVPMPEVALVGTSYSANPNWNFEGATKLALNEDVLNFATEGEGPIVPMLNFVEGALHDLPALRLVIWEIPERYLVQSYPSKLPNVSVANTEFN